MRLYKIASNVPHWWEELDARERKLAEAAISYHSLLNPGQTITYAFYMGSSEQFPVLTSTETFTEDYCADAENLGQVTARSLVEARKPTESLDKTLRPLEDSNHRYIRLTPTVTNDSVQRQRPEKRLIHRVYDFLEDKTPQFLDEARVAGWALKESRAKQYVERYGMADVIEALVEKEGAETWKPVPPRSHNGPRAALFGLHWLQSGGAERWAIEAIQIAREAGLLPIVITDQQSHHNWITRPELDGCILLPLDFPLQVDPGGEPLLAVLSQVFNISSVFVHHCGWLYERLPWIRQHIPGVYISDSLHIVEYAKGGYPGTGALFDDYIDEHHVISPQLVDWLIEYREINPSKITLAPLIGLTTDTELGYRERPDDREFTIAFIGRLARQKRPDVFLSLAAALYRRYPNIRFILQGDGELESMVDKRTATLGLGRVIERRHEDVPVSQTLADSDLLLLTSGNEGLTLTTLEAVAAGVPVISADVGSQRTLIPKQALLPRRGRAMVRKAVPLVGALMADDRKRRRLWEAEVHAVEEFSALQSAADWMRTTVKRIKETGSDHHG
ncbi:glycosyltransferase [Scrofimicrobium canadense]|nr:glycosyltransferase [Scrofimicrobium canadense]